MPGDSTGYQDENHWVRPTQVQIFFPRKAELTCTYSSDGSDSPNKLYFDQSLAFELRKRERGSGCLEPIVQPSPFVLGQPGLAGLGPGNVSFKAGMMAAIGQKASSAWKE